jgi:hypothetical protein
MLLRRIFGSALLALLVTCSSLLPAPAAGAQGAPARTFRDFGYGDLTARTMYGSLNYFFPVPRGQEPRIGSRLELLTSHSPLLTPDRSTLTVAVNGQSLTSFFLTEQNRARARMVIPLPVDAFTGTGYFVQIQFSLRLTREVCEEAQNPALWATVHGDSLVLLPTQPSSQGPRLEDLPDLLYPTAAGAATSAPTMTLPAAPKPDELAAAGLVSYQIGRWASVSGRSPGVTLAATPAPDQPAILVGSGAALSPATPWGALGWDGQQFQTAGGTVPAEHGVLALKSEGAPRLLVSGATPGAVRAAAEALLQPERRVLIGGEHTLVTGAPVIGLPAPAWQAGTASFAQLGVDRRRVGGPGEHIIDLPFDRPAGWTLRDGSSLELAVEASPAVRPETSWLAVAVNGMEIGSRRLETGTGEPRRYRFNLPADQLNGGLDGQPLRRLALNVRIYLDLPQTGCTAMSTDATWAMLLPTSAWLLPHTPYTGLDLGRFPAPMLGDSAARPLSVVLPDDPTPAELDAGLNIMAALGHWAVAPAPTPRLTVATHLTDDERRQQHLILVGGADRNRVTAALAQRAPTFCPAGIPAAYRLTPGERRAMLCLGWSPWARDLTVLLVAGSAAEDLTVGVQALARRELLSRLRGQAATIVDGLPPQPSLPADPPTPPPATLAPRVEATFTERLPAWQVVGAVLLGGFITVVALLLWTRWRKRGRG